MNRADQGFVQFQDEGFIPGIHDYCDLWCERCPSGFLCPSRALGAGPRTALARRSRRNAAYWKENPRQLRRVAALLARAGGASGATGPLPGPGCLAPAAHRYAAGAADWVAARESLVEERLDDLWVARKSGLTQAQALRRAASLEDAVAVVSWYGFLISYKVARALTDRAGSASPGRHQGWFRAPDGTAKTALVSMDRSLGAWAGLHGFLPEEEGAILGFMGRLHLLRQGLEQVFPGARAFVRPGFDTPRETVPLAAGLKGR